MGFRAHVAPFLAVFASCACTFTRDKKADEHLTLQEHATQQGEQQTTETVRSGPETITTTTEEWETPPLSLNSGQHLPSFDGPGQSAGPVSARGATPILPPQAHLVKRTVTVDQRGPVVATKASSAIETGCEDVGLDLTKHTEDDSNTSPALAGYLWMVLAAAAVVVAGWLAWKFSLPGKILALFGH